MDQGSVIRESGSEVDEIRTLISDLSERIDRLEDGSIKDLAIKLSNVESIILSHIAEHKHVRRRKDISVTTRRVGKPIRKDGVLLRGFLKGVIDVEEAEKSVRSNRKKWRLGHT